jgi:hypothetical protein
MDKLIKLRQEKGYKSFLFLKSCICILLFSFIILTQSCNFGPQTQNITLTYLVKDNNLYYNRITGAILLGENPKLRVYTTVTNTSDYGGVFKFYAKLSSQGNSIEFQNEKYIGSGSTVTFSEEKEINPYSFETNVKVDSWGIIAPIKTVQLR